MPKVGKIRAAIEGKSYLPRNGLADYHAAAAVMAALRRREPRARLSAVRAALNQYRVCAWLVDGGIELRDGGTPLLVV